jgi:hypothetical protein
MAKITEAFAASQEPKDRDVVYSDTQLPGFLLRITPKGRKIFIARGRVAGRRRAGGHPRIQFDDARVYNLMTLRIQSEVTGGGVLLYLLSYFSLNLIKHGGNG